MKFLRWGMKLLGIVVLLLIGWLHFSPPDLIRVGANYSAKIVCSNVFLAGRNPYEVLAVDVQAPGHPILSVMQVSVDYERKQVSAGLFGFFGKGLAIYREGFGCAAVPDGDLTKVAAMPAVPKAAAQDESANWPSGSKVSFTPNAKLEAVLNDVALQGPGIRAIVVVKNGAIVGEHYADGFDAKTPLLGWSMAKTVTAGLVGVAVKEDLTTIDAQELFPEWANDKRSEIELQDLLGMASDLNWNEGYGTVSDVTRLLYLQPDMARFVKSKLLDTADGSNRGKVYNYSSGTSVLVGHYLSELRQKTGQDIGYPYADLFHPIGAQSMTIEADARGNLTAGSYVYASARDWARYGQFLLQKGQWQGQQILPEGFVDWMTTAHPASEDGDYGKGHIWRRPPGAKRPGDNPPFDHRAWWLAGHDGQSVAILPDENLVIVRLGLTPSKLQYKAAKLANAVAAALKE